LLARAGAILVAGLSSAIATTVVPPTFETLVNESDYIVHVRVRSAVAEKKRTVHGDRIVTRVALETIEVVAGRPPAEITLDFLGGRVGEEELVVEGAPRFRAGDEDILFVRDNGRSICPLYGMMHGRYPVKKVASGRSFMIRSDGLPLVDAGQVSAPLTDSVSRASARSLTIGAALTPGEFIRRIRAEVKPDARLNRAK
jgi:hypothetical protein